MNEKKIVTLKEILDNPEETIEVPTIGYVKVKCPTIKDKIEAKDIVEEYSKSFSEDEKSSELARVIALKMLVEPVISLEEYRNSNDIKIGVILDTIDMWYALKMKDVTIKRKKMLKDFLEQMKEITQ